jgi:phage/plasmid-like protein (TIGR03299 family)
MAHMIEDNQISWNRANGAPWHGLGTSVDAGTTAEVMLKLAGLDFPVEAMDIELAGLPNTAFLANFKAIGRRDTNKVFGVSSKRYQIHQNKDILSVFDEYCNAGHAQMDVIGALKGGAVVWALAKLNGRTTVTMKGGDTVTGYLLMVGSHDGTLPTQAIATQERAVCNNTLFPAMRSGRVGFKMKHSKEWTSESATLAKEQMGIAIEKIEEFNALGSQLQNVSIDRKGQIEFISQLLDGKCILDQTIEATQATQAVSTGFDSDASLLDAIMGTSPSVSLAPIAVQNGEDKLNRVGKAILESILTSPGSDLDSAHNTLWGALNGVSYYTDHVASRTQDSRLYNAWFGSNVELKQSAVDVAKQMAGIN